MKAKLFVALVLAMMLFGTIPIDAQATMTEYDAVPSLSFWSFQNPVRSSGAIGSTATTFTVEGWIQIDLGSVQSVDRVDFRVYRNVAGNIYEQYEVEVDGVSIGAASLPPGTQFHGLSVDPSSSFIGSTVRIRKGSSDIDPANLYAIYDWVRVWSSPVDELVADFEADPYSGYAPLFVSFTDTSSEPDDDPIDTWLWEISESEADEYTILSTDQNPTFNFILPGTYDIRLTVLTESDESDSVVKQISVSGDPPPSFVRPFRAADETTPGDSVANAYAPIVRGFMTYDRERFDIQAEAALAFTNNPSGVVHSAVDGTVLSIVPLTSTDCNPSDNQCYAFFSNAPGGFGEVPGLVRYLAFPLANSHAVTIQDDNGDLFIYAVQNAYQYIEVSQEIAAGCPLGEGIPITEQQTWLGSIVSFITDGILAVANAFFDTEELEEFNDAIFSGVQYQGVSFTFIQRSAVIEDQETTVEIVSYLNEDVDDKPRLCDYIATSCLNPDQNFENPERWVLTGGNYEPSGGIRLEPGGRIETATQLALDSMTAHGAEVRARSLVTGQGGSIRVGIGLTQQDLAIPANTFSYLSLASTTHQPNIGLDYTVSITNNGTTPVYLTSFCISTEAGTGQPNQCYFQNYSFDGLPATQGWTTSMSGISAGIAAGEIIVEDGASVGQNVTLYPDGANPYAYRIVIVATPDGFVDDWKDDSSTTVDFAIEYETTSGFENIFLSHVSMPFPFSGFYSAQFAPAYEVTFWTTITVTELTSGPMTFRFDIDSPFPNQRLRIKEICIDDPFENWGPGLPPPPLPANCSAVSVPQGNEIGQWIFYHWSNLDRFFQCDLMVMLNKMFNLGYEAYTLAGWQARYWQSSARIWSNWLATDLFPWLNGHFRNMAIGQVTTINNDSGTSIWDVLLALIQTVFGPLIDMLGRILDLLISLVTQAADLLFTVISAFLSIFFWLIIQIFTLFDMARELITSLLNAWNTATPTAIDGLPQCTINPQQNGFCVGLWFMEHTFFSGRGALFIPLLIGVGSIHLMLWAFGTFKRELLQIGQAT